jgi:cytochrome oxidase assembly protein ShyY1
MLEPLEDAGPKLKVVIVVVLSVLAVTSSLGFWLLVTTPSVDLTASLQNKKHQNVVWLPQ